MKKWVEALVLGAVLCMSVPVDAHAEGRSSGRRTSAFRQPGGLLDTGSHERSPMLSVYGILPWWYGFGFGAAGRFGIPIVEDGFISKLNDSVELEFGGDAHREQPRSAAVPGGDQPGPERRPVRRKRGLDRPTERPRLPRQRNLERGEGSLGELEGCEGAGQREHDDGSDDDGPGVVRGESGEPGEHGAASLGRVNRVTLSAVSNTRGTAPVEGSSVTGAGGLLGP